MAKDSNSNVYYCTACGYETSGYLGKCPRCGSWGTLEEKPVKTKTTSKRAGVNTGWLEESQASVVKLNQVKANRSQHFSSGLSEFDRALGGGFVPGSLVLVGGEPGIGKSTLLIQALANIDLKADENVLYVSGEESFEQVKARAERLHLDTSDIILSGEVVFEDIAKIIAKLEPKLCVVDSIQTIYSAESSSSPGSVSQVRDCAAGFLRIAKALGTCIVLVGHVTKDGNVAGPRTLEHMVDTVIYFSGDQYSNLRIVRAEKNRFGATNELGIFEMTGHGLVPVDDASEALLAGSPKHVPGSAITSVIEGSRALIIEIQALLNPTNYASPLRVTQGIDRTRVSMLMALVEKKLGLGLSNVDAFINVIGGIKADDPATDLALIAAIVSSFNEKPLKDKLLLAGEVGLTGEVRPVSNVELRIKEASKLNFNAMILPGSNRKQVKKLNLDNSLEIVFVDNINEAMDIIW